MALSKKRKAFIEEYLKDFNATQAAIRAGYSVRSAHAIGHENLNIPEIADEISRRIEERVMSSDEVLLRLGEQARAEYSPYIEVKDGQAYVDLDGMKRDGKMHMIKGIKNYKHGQQIEFHDSQTALVHIGRKHKMFTDKQELTGKDGKPPEVVVRFERVDKTNDD